jgi:hydrogenase-4 component E
MTDISEIILAVLLLIDLALVTSGRMLQCIRLAALHGVLIGIFPLVLWDFFNDGFPHLPVLLTAAAGLLIKGLLLPRLLRHAMDHAKVKRELEPWIGYAESLGIVLLVSGAVFYLWMRYAETPAGAPMLAAPVAFITMFTGLFITISRRKALTQVVGFLIFENGITAFGMGMGVECGLLVELGIMLDVLVLVIVTGIAVAGIKREFSHIDSDQMHELGDISDSDECAKEMWQ